jgi:hypothetical protein
MSAAAALQKAAGKPLEIAGASLFLQRKCACGAGTSSIGGECNECRKKKILGLQTKLRINEPGDAYEQEADRVAEQVLAKRVHPGVSNAPLRIQRFSGQPSGQASVVPPSVEGVLASAGSPLEPALRRDMEQRFGRDFSSVRVHVGTAAEQSARDVDADAYTVRNDIVFGEGRFTPATSEGRRLLAHELTHLVQQSGSESSIAQIQRQRRGAAAGCGICMNDPGGKLAGDIAHAEVQAAFIAYNPNMVAERPVPGIPNSGIDLSYEKRRLGQHALFIGEIKPLDDAGRQADIGRIQLQDYAREMLLSGEYDEVFRMTDAPSPGPLYFFNWLNPPGCPQQMITVQLTEPGLYQYYCEPPFSQLVRNPSCRCTRRDDPEPPGPPPIPPIYVRPGDEPSQTETQGEGEGKGYGEPGEGDQPRIDEPGRQPGKGNGEPGKGDGRHKPGQPGRRPPGPSLPGGAALLTVLTVLTAILALTPQGRFGQVIGAVLGTLLRWLGFTLAIGAGAAVASAGTSGRKGGAPARTPPPASRTTVLPTQTQQPGTSSPQHPIPAAPERKGPSVSGTSARKPPEKTRAIKVDVIEGLNLEQAVVGILPVVWLHPKGKPDEKLLAVLQVTSKVTHGNTTTVEFKSLLETKRDATRWAATSTPSPARVPALNRRPWWAKRR